MNNLSNSTNRILIKILIFVWTLWVLAPVLNSGFVGDDAYNSLINGLLISTGIPQWEHTFTEIFSWATQAGRIFPFMWIYLHGLYSITQDLVLIKVVTLLIISLDLFLFFKIVKSLTKNEDFSYLCTFILPLFFQFRWFHDPILSFTFLMPMMCLFFFSSTLYLIAYLKNGKRYFLVLSTLIYLLALLTYEITYSFLFVYIGIILFNVERKRGVKFILYVGFLTLIHIASSKYLVNLRIAEHGVSTYPGSLFNLDIMKAIEAFYIQLTATIPLSWKFAFAPFHQKFYHISLENIVIYSVFATLFSKAISRFDYSLIDKKNLYKCMAFSFFAFTGPALAMALSGHQQELLDAGFGYAYTPVFIQYFGLAVFTIMLLLFIKNKFPNYKKIVFLFIWLLIFSIGTITREENILIVEKSNQFYKYPRDILGASLDEGLLDGITEEDLILRFMRYPSDYYTFYNQKTGKNLNVCGFNIPHQFPICLKDFEGYSTVEAENPLTLKKKSSGKTYGISYFLGKNYITGSVLIAKIDQITLVNGLPMQVTFRDYKIFNYLDKKITKFSSARKHDFLKLIPHELDRDREEFDLDYSITSEVSVAYKGFHLEDRSSSRDEYLRWSSGKSEIVLMNTSDSNILVRIDMVLIRPKNANGDGLASILLSYGDKVMNYDVDFRKEISLNINVKPGLNNLKVTCDSPFIENGDPRKIVFGIGNYKVLQI